MEEIEKIKRKKKVNDQDKQQPNTIQDLIRRYDLDNVKEDDYLDYLRDYLKRDITEKEQRISALESDIVNKVTKTTILNNVDLNNRVNETGFFFIMGGSNRPEETNGYLLVQRYSDTYVSQEYITTAGVKYIRTLRSGTWNDWQHITQPETTTNTNGTAVKYADGTMICYNSKEYTNVDITTQSNGVYYKAFGCTFPVAFYAKPTVTPIVEQNAGIIWASLGNIGDLTKTGCGLRAICMTSMTGRTLNVGYIAVGRWKA